ncbi:MAG TPA: patatin-like phospholipase family protein [Nitrososphaeraceae archaeon]|nr:patatin-like phospholipase family protein [Nitrososphaeraceae archaeon]
MLILRAAMSLLGMTLSYYKTMGNLHRALVFQGGGALGAYEAGTYQQMYKKVSKESTDGRLFDIVAGTSIGAINSSVLVGHYLKNESWDGSAEKLLEFWEGLMCPTVADSLFNRISPVRISWDYFRMFNHEVADAESARRFWSIFEFAFSPRGVTNMYKSIPYMGSKFLNPFTDFLPWWRYDYTPLRNYLSKFIEFPIKTSLEKGQPRLLLTSVDIQDFTSPVVFDSYEKLHDAPVKHSAAVEKKVKEGSSNRSSNGDGSGRWFSEYGNSESRHIVFYDGIGPDQVLASALGKYAIDHPHVEDSNTGTMRQLWDGGYLSNTPLRELLTAHKTYWMEYLRMARSSSKREGAGGDERMIGQTPELEVYIVNLHPLTPKDIPKDKDLIDDREADIFFHDRTTYDEQVAYAFTDFVNMTRDLVELARSNGLSEKVDEILDKNAKTIARVGEYRFTTNRDLFLGKPRISKVWRIDRLESADATFGKVTDFTPSTIKKLIEAGKIDARISIDRMELIFGVEELISEGIMSMEEGDEIIKEAREVVTTEQLLYRKRKDEIEEAYNRYIEKIKAKDLPPECEEILISPGRDIVSLLTEANTNISNNYNLTGGQKRHQ